jgi:hypothetical protein
MDARIQEIAVCRECGTRHRTEEPCLLGLEGGILQMRHHGSARNVGEHRSAKELGMTSILDTSRDGRVRASSVRTAEKAGLRRNAYQREYMKRRRAAKRAEINAAIAKQPD